MNREKITFIIVLHISLAIYSISGIFSKEAANDPFLSAEFCFLYFGIVVLLGFYAIVWQQIIKHLPLTIAFANKAVTVIWGIIWGFMFFDETVTTIQMIGAGIIMIGIILYSTEIAGSCKCHESRKHDSITKEYLNPKVVIAYILFIGTTLLSIIAYRVVPLSMGPVLESTSYIWIMIFGVTIFGERITKRKLFALATIIVGIIIFSFS